MDYSELKRITENEHMKFYDHEGYYEIENSDGIGIIQFEKSTDGFSFAPFKDLKSLPLPSKVIEAIIAYINTPIQLKNDTDNENNIARKIIDMESAIEMEGMLTHLRNWKYSDQVDYFNKLNELLEMRNKFNEDSIE